jgi:hypothetical protein
VQCTSELVLPLPATFSIVKFRLRGLFKSAPFVSTDIPVWISIADTTQSYAAVRSAGLLPASQAPENASCPFFCVDITPPRRKVAR